jgi:hypothetical protein
VSDEEAEPEPNVMFCLDCMYKHTRDLEHHMEDAVRVDKEAREFWEEQIDRVREMRKYILDRMRGKRHSECVTCTGEVETGPLEED